MHRFLTLRWLTRPRAKRGFWPAWAFALLLMVMPAPPAYAEAPEISSFEVVRNDDGVQLDFALRFELPRSVEDAMQRGVPLYFVAEAEVFRDRWYWRDRRVNKVTRTWRLAYQPLTRTYRVSFGGLNQSFDTLIDAVAAVRRVSSWKLADASQIEEGARHYVEFSYKLDTSLLPRPMQIGVGGLTDWTLQVEKVQRFN